MEEKIGCKAGTVGADALQNIRHSHNAHEEILFVERGRGAFIIGDRMFPLSGGCIYFIARNTLHCSAPVERAEYVRSAVSIRSDFWEELGRISGYAAVFSELAGKGCVALDGIAAKKAAKSIEALASGEHRQRVRELFVLLDTVAGQGSPMDVQDNKVSGIMAYINGNLADNITLDRIAEALFINKYYMCHVFKDTTGMSISRYILLQRLTLAKRLLTASEQSISDISTACGFSSFSYFSRIFRKTEGMSASEYRRRFGMALRRGEVAF